MLAFRCAGVQVFLGIRHFAVFFLAQVNASVVHFVDHFTRGSVVSVEVILELVKGFCGCSSSLEIGRAWLITVSADVDGIGAGHEGSDGGDGEEGEFHLDFL